jgi:ketosteroid isomerase-like protein
MPQLKGFVVVVLLAVGPVSTVAQITGGEEPALIKKVVETTVRAINKDDLKTLLAQLADDALIDSAVAGGKVSKEKYGQAMAEAFKKGDLVSLELRDFTITMVDSSRATALGTLYAQTRTGRGSGRVEWKLEKREGRWLIVETNRQ